MLVLISSQADSLALRQVNKITECRMSSHKMLWDLGYFT